MCHRREFLLFNSRRLLRRGSGTPAVRWTDWLSLPADGWRRTSHRDLRLTERLLISSQQVAIHEGREIYAFVHRVMKMPFSWRCRCRAEIWAADSNTRPPVNSMRPSSLAPLYWFRLLCAVLAEAASLSVAEFTCPTFRAFPLSPALGRTNDPVCGQSLPPRCTGISRAGS